MTAAVSPDALLGKTLHLASDAIPWVPLLDGAEHRLIHARLDDGFVVTQFRAQPGVTTGLHRHGAPVLGFTTKGAWGHDRRYEYRPGTYIFETPGVLHRFMNGPEVSEVFFVNFSDIEMVDPETKDVTGTVTRQDQIQAYFTKCEELGLARPNVLGA